MDTISPKFSVGGAVKSNVSPPHRNMQVSSVATVSSHQSSFFQNVSSQVSAPPTTILTANGSSLTLTLTFQGTLSINGDGGYLHEISGEVFNVGVVPGLGKPCIIGTLVMAQMGIGVHPGSPGRLSLAHPGDPAKIVGWAQQEKMEAFTPYPADPVDWPRVEQSFWGKERRTWGGAWYHHPPSGYPAPPTRGSHPNAEGRRGGMFLHTGADSRGPFSA